MATLSLLFLTALVLGIHKGYLNTFDVQIQKNEIPVDLPAGMELKILHLSDMHLENLSISPQELYEKVKNFEVDLIALTGDQIERKQNIEPFMEYIRVLKKINPSLGIYVVFGNHDYLLRGHHLQRFRRRLEEEGCVVMQNENRTLQFGGEKIHVIGIDDFSTRRSDLSKAYRGVGEGVKLVLTHDPNLVIHMKDVPFDYLLSGHFHGGQICYPKPYHLAKMGKLARLNIIKGLHYQDGKPFYISEGLGQTGINIRTGPSRPEIAIHILKGTRAKREDVAQAI